MPLRFAPFVAGGYIPPAGGLPTAPGSVVATAGNAQSTVTFSTVPGVITNYTATSSPGGLTGSSATNSINVAGVNGTAYTYTVTATNAIGIGPASAPSNSVTPVAPTVPAAPTIGLATAGNGLATVAYTLNGTGGSPITVVTATSAPGGLTATGASPITVTGLTNGVAYTLSVKATNAVGNSLASGNSNSVTPTASTNYVLYSSGTLNAAWPPTPVLSFSCTLNYSYAGTTPTPDPGSSASLQVVTSGAFGGGFQPGSAWGTIPPNGFDLSPYTQMQFDIYTPGPSSMYLGSHYTRSTGNDLNASTSITQGSTAWSIPANTWTTVRVPLSSVAMLSSFNFYKFVIGTSTTFTYYLDKIQFIPGNVGWAFRGTGTPVSGWSNASTVTADYTWLPQSINGGTGGLFAINNPAAAASQFIASCAGTTLTVSSITSGSINIGDLACWDTNTPVGTIVSGTFPTYTLSAAATVSSRNWASAPAQATVTGVKLTAGVVNGTLKLTTASFTITPYTTFTFGVIPTKAGYGYQVQFYTTAGVATGSAITMSSTYTQHDFGVTTGSFTVYNVPLSAFGTLPANIGGFSIKETSANTSNITYFSAIGFYS